MATRYAAIPERWIRFISEQKIFFVGTAADDGRVNLSPKGIDCLRVLDANRVTWLSVTSSGNETATHILAGNF